MQGSHCVVGLQPPVAEQPQLQFVWPALKQAVLQGLEQALQVAFPFGYEPP